MAGTVYSTRFGLQLNGATVTYTVPGQKRAVVKSVTAFNTAAVTSQLALQINGTSVWVVNIASNQAAAVGEQMMVLNAGEQLRLVASAGVNAQISGYLLDETG